MLATTLDRDRSVAGTVATRPGAVAVLITTWLALCLAPGVAHAHDVLLSSDPADGAVLEEAPERLTLVFSAEQLPLGAATSVTGPDGQEWAEGSPDVDGTTVVQPLAPGMPAGDYAVAWRSVAGDGHPVSGTLAFTVGAPASRPEPAAPEPAVPEPAAPEPAAPEPAAPEPAGPGPAGGDDDGDASAGDPADTSARLPVLVVAIVAAVLVVAATVAALRRRQPARG